MRYAAVALMIGVFLLAGSDTQSFANPGLASCRVCGDKVAKEAEACPHCGAPKPWDGKTVTTWHENGKKKSEYKNRWDGKHTNWYKNGQKYQEVHYKDGRLDGLVTEWWTNGKKWREKHYKDGRLDGLRTDWHENGQKAFEQHYKNGKQDGLRTR